jgi:hypothetical protein
MLMVPEGLGLWSATNRELACGGSTEEGVGGAIDYCIRANTVYLSAIFGTFLMHTCPCITITM